MFNHYFRQSTLTTFVKTLSVLATTINEDRTLSRQDQSIGHSFLNLISPYNPVQPSSYGFVAALSSGFYDIFDFLGTIGTIDNPIGSGADF